MLGSRSLPGSLRYAPKVRALLPLGARRRALPTVRNHLLQEVGAAVQMRLTRTYEDFSNFYDHIYLPQQRQQPEAAPALGKDRLWRALSHDSQRRHGRLLLFERQGQPLGGLMLATRRDRPNTLMLQHLGLLRPELLGRGQRHNLHAMMELRAAQHAGAAGFAQLDLGLVDARLDDAAYQRLDALGCTMQQDAALPSVSLHVPAPHAAKIFARSPLLAERAGRLEDCSSVLRLAPVAVPG